MRRLAVMHFLTFPIILQLCTGVSIILHHIWYSRALPKNSSSSLKFVVCIHGFPRSLDRCSVWRDRSMSCQSAHR
jgi:hypothetical protein